VSGGAPKQCEASSHETLRWREGDSNDIEDADSGRVLAALQKELFAGAVPDAVMARYLIRDHRFLDSFLTLLGAALASADTFAARLRFGRFIGMVSAEEDTFFVRAFEALGVTEDRRTADPDTQATAGFKAIMREAAETRSYAATLSVLVVAEWLYLDWASRAPKPLPDNFVHAEWITLHDNPDFRDFVGFLRAVLLPPRRRHVQPIERRIAGSVRC
jgi:thiaminase/transcriptional activator TenA